ncbi:hypothetical protein M0802_003274 [Mischocyttarus mexicanus]|nr:hypothetical protein M0802_003274 [Mischocyttarus mexicanus]
MLSLKRTTGYSIMERKKCRWNLPQYLTESRGPFDKSRSSSSGSYFRRATVASEGLSESYNVGDIAKQESSI